MRSIIPQFNNIPDLKERKMVMATFVGSVLILLLQISFDIYMDIFSLNVDRINPVMLVFAVFTMIFAGVIYTVSSNRIKQNSTANLGQLMFASMVMLAVIMQSAIVGSRQGKQQSEAELAVLTLSSLIMAVIIICASIPHIVLLMKQVIDIVVDCQVRCVPPQPPVSEYESFQTPPEQV